MVRLCRRPGCNRPVRASAGTKPCSYCEEHVRAPRTDGADMPQRSEAQIRADLAAQLTVAVRRFNSMVAHDAATDPLR